MRKFIPFAAIFMFTAGLFSFSISSQESREQRDQPEKLLDIAGVKSGMIVGEAGAGDGFLTFFLSKRVGATGHVYANDIDSASLQRLSERSRTEGRGNITTVLGKVDDPLFPVKGLDLVIMINAFHDFTERVAWLKNVKKYLKADAGIFIFDKQNKHFSKDIAKSEAEQAGFRMARSEHIQDEMWFYELRVNPPRGNPQT